MKLNFIAFGIPIIFLLIGLEYYFAKKTNKKFFSFGSSVSNISIGIAERLAQLFLTTYFIIIFQFIYDHFAIFSIEQNLYNWLLLFLLTDLIWYWYHRLSHEVNIFWGAHIVHHSSEEYNLTVSLRITIYQSFIRLLFGLVLPVIGFPLPMLLTSISLLGIYQFFIHTRFIKNLGFLENILVTPSNHRVHHGNNEKYIDKNYGGILIIWDKLFGTYQNETEEVNYGLTKQVNSHSFLWLHFHYWLELWEHVKFEKGILNKLKILFGNPGKLKLAYEDKLRSKYLSQNSLTSPEINKENYPVLYRYIEAQIISSLLLLFLAYFIELTALTNFLISAIITITVINCGAILEQKKWIFNVEIIRFIAVSALIVYSTKQILLLIVIPIILICLIEEYRLIKILYFKKLYKRK